MGCNPTEEIYDDKSAPCQCPCLWPCFAYADTVTTSAICIAGTGGSPKDPNERLDPTGFLALAERVT